MFHKIVVIAVLAAALSAAAQERAFVSGRVVDKDTRDPLPAYVMIDGGEGISANAAGRFRLSLPPGTAGKVGVVVFLLGYKKARLSAEPGADLTIELELEPLAAREITVTADSVVSDAKNPRTVSLNKMEIYRMPGAAADPLYASQALPGVNALPDSTSLLIRGGAPEEVGYYLDGIEIRHPFMSESLHESYFSIFDTQIVEAFSVATTGVHPKYGDLLSGTMDIAVKDGAAKLEAGLGLSVLGVNSYLAQPLADWGSFIGSFNWQFSDVLNRLNGWEGQDFGSTQAFGKFNLRLNPRNVIRIYGLADDYRYEKTGQFSVGSKNGLAALTWTATLWKNFVAKAILARTTYSVRYEEAAGMRAESRDAGWQTRVDGAWDAGRHYFEFGGEAFWRSLSSEIHGPAEGVFETKAVRTGFYVNDKFRLTDRLYASAGLRVSALNLAGTQAAFDPRVSLARMVGKNDVLRLSAGVYHQFADPMSLGRNPGLRPLTAYHAALSFDRIRENLELRAAAYDKEYRTLFWTDGQGRSTNGGFGYARGAEAFVKVKSTAVDVIAVYNFMTSQRKEGSVAVLAPSPYEIHHSGTAIVMGKFKGVSLSARFSIATGRPYTPLAASEWDAETSTAVLVWGAPYSARYPLYRRLDLSGNANFRVAGRQVVLYFGVTNVLNWTNTLRYDYDNSGVRMDQTSLFGRTLFVGAYALL